ncbi:FG-GAP repeat domain-containing protein [Dyadobacter sandarakinus]|uniref:VCBS repeat-containing protein n=1 Tax=Dyadobacter sandarakinus TaxID=2747268 RepID=A0ABX7I8L4_9BACT|nr:VCBS repeat-containing protein [Dyadobacter sandarakinus]QRR01812.1 VCBS repeat-containing protein [Dyadobacter sandarakinus]
MKTSFWVVIFLVVSLYSCTPGSDRQVADTSAKKYCTTCHSFPEPDMLDKQTWENHVLPAMAEKLGIEVLQGNIYLHHKTSVVGVKEWNAIVQYYKTLAPDSLPLSRPDTHLRDISALFTIRKPHLQSETASNTTLVAFDPAHHRILSGNAFNPSLSFWDRSMRKVRQVDVPSPAVAYLPGKQLVTCLGGMQASDKTIGQIVKVQMRSEPALFLDSLIRPVQTISADFNRDGLPDYLVSAFGHNRGGLYVFTQNVDLTFEQRSVQEIPGATQSVVRDFNRDGWPDFMTLFAHGDEGIWLFMNDRKGGFRSTRILRFPPVYGSSSFQLADLNGDGLEDILYTAGDNSDYSRILKPYHGIYIYTNTGDLTFRQTHFFPMHGCTRALAGDFDQDGDLDVAAIAFFADFRHGRQQTFLYLEQQKAAQGNHTDFIPATLPIGHEGRWICMDAGDWDGDGDEDLVLGSFSRGFLNQDDTRPDWNVYTPFIVLENTSAGKSTSRPASSLPAAR